MSGFKIRPIMQKDREWVSEVLRENWESAKMVSRGIIHPADTYPGFIATLDGEGIGLITYRIEGIECEIVTLNSLTEGDTIGSMNFPRFTCL